MKTDIHFTCKKIFGRPVLDVLWIIDVPHSVNPSAYNSSPATTWHDNLHGKTTEGIFVNLYLPHLRRRFRSSGPHVVPR